MSDFMLGRFGFYKYSDIVPYWDKEENRSIILFDSSSPEKLQGQIKKLFKAKYVVLTNYGRTALYLGFKSLGLKPGTKVAVPSLMCGSAIDAIIKAGFNPVFVDVNNNFGIDIKSLESAIKKGVKAILIPTLAGNVGNFSEVLKVAKKYKLFVIDDAAQSFGAKYKNKLTGTFGDFGILSFNIGKNLYAGGGGVLLTNKKKIFDAAIQFLGNESKFIVFWRVFDQILKTRFRKCTRPFFYIKDNFFLNSKFPKPAKMSFTVSALALSQIKKLNIIIKKRQENAELLSKLIKNLSLRPIYDQNSIYTKYLVELPKDKILPFRKFLRIQGIETEAFYKPLHLKERYQNCEKCDLSNSEKLWKNICILPVSSNFEKEDIIYVAEQINLFFS